MKYQEWIEQVPPEIKQDPLWQTTVYRQALFVGDLAWHDIEKLAKDRRMLSLSDQLYRAAGSISANISEGYSRASGRDQARYYEYALGSTRELRDWYFKARHVLGPDVFNHRIGLIAEIAKQLVRMVPKYRGDKIEEMPSLYDTRPSGTSADQSLTEETPNHAPDIVDPRTTHYALSESALESGVVPRRGDTVMVAGDGCWMIDAEGKRYLDMTAGQGVAMLGYGHPVLSAAIAEQAQTLHACPSFFYNDVRARFLEKLIEVTPNHLGHVFLANSGAEANDGAIKFARLATGRTKIIATKNGFHGRTVGAVSLTWNPKYREQFGPLLPDVEHVAYGNLQEFENAVDDQTAAVFIEAVQGEGGVNLATPEYWAGVERICREHGALLVFDEVQTGFRTGRWFAHQHFGLHPDIITVAKGLGGGFPMAAIVYTGQIQESLFSGAHGSTFGGSPLACAAGLAALETYQNDGLIERAGVMGDLIRQKLETVLEGRRMVREIRGLGLMIGIDLRSKVAPFLKALMDEHNVIALPAGTTVLRLLPPLIISEEEVDIAVNAIAAVIPA
ncbi:acetylornithine/succinylornithine family transaminase [bacterium]|nr:acetylornithine/succinylornithine family transaminase [bacterium]